MLITEEKSFFGGKYQITVEANGGTAELDLLEGDKVSAWICSESSATMTVYDANLGLRMEYVSDL